MRSSCRRRRRSWSTVVTTVTAAKIALSLGTNRIRSSPIVPFYGPARGYLYPFTAQKYPKPFQLHFWILCHFGKHSKYKIITYSRGSCAWIFQETNHFRTSIFPNQCLITRECENTRYTSLCANKMPMYRMITALFKNTEKGFLLQIE